MSPASPAAPPPGSGAAGAYPRTKLGSRRASFGAVARDTGGLDARRRRRVLGRALLLVFATLSSVRRYCRCAPARCGVHLRAHLANSGRALAIGARALRGGHRGARAAPEIRRAELGHLRLRLARVPTTSFSRTPPPRRCRSRCPWRTRGCRVGAAADPSATSTTTFADGRAMPCRIPAVALCAHTGFAERVFARSARSRPAEGAARERGGRERVSRARRRHRRRLRCFQLVRSEAFLNHIWFLESARSVVPARRLSPRRRRAENLPPRRRHFRLLLRALGGGGALLGSLLVVARVGGRGRRFLSIFRFLGTLIVPERDRRLVGSPRGGVLSDGLGHGGLGLGREVRACGARWGGPARRRCPVAARARRS